MKRTRGQGIVRVSDLFAKYKENLKPPQKAVVEAFVETVREVAHVPLKPHECSYTAASRTIALKASGMIKTEIFMRREQILEKVAEKIGKKFAPKSIV